MARPRETSSAVTRFVALLTLLAVPLLVTAGVSSPSPDAVTIVIAGVLLLNGLLPLRFRRDADVHGLTFDEAALVALLLTGHAQEAVVVLAGGAAVAHVAQRAPAVKVAFNTAQIALTSWVAVLTFEAIGSGVAPLDARSVVAAAMATIVFDVLGLLLVAEIFRRLQGQARRVTLAETGPANVAVWLANTAVGLLLAVLASNGTPALLLGALVALALQVGYRAYAGLSAAQRRAARLQSVTHRLVGLGGRPDALGAFLGDLADLFACRVADVIEVDDVAPRLTRWVDGHVSTSSLDHDLVPEAREALRRGTATRIQLTETEGVRLAAPVVENGHVLAILTLAQPYGLEPWSNADVDLLASLANELAVALRNVALFHDVDRERAKLAAESSKLNDLVQTTSDGIAMIDGRGRIAVWNTGMVATTGVPEAEALGQPWFVVLRLREANGLEVLEQGDNALSVALRGGGGAAGVSLQVLRRDGQWRWLRCTVNPVADSGAVVVARDVTAEREVEQLKADFVATVSHELRTPLTPLLGFVETMDQLGDALTGARRDQVLAAMRNQLNRLRRLVDDLLVVADTDRGASRFVPRPMDLSAAVVEALDERTDERLDLLVPAGVSATGDVTVVGRIVGELVGNALRHTTGRVRVEVHADERVAAVRVTDEGPGIPSWEHDTVFRRFGRLGDHLHRTQGAGLGLSIARGLARELGGDVTLDSDVGRGSTFTLVLNRTTTQLPASVAA